MRRGLLLFLLATACEPHRPIGPLPTLLTAVLALEGGGYASLALRLPRPGEPALPRLSPGLLALGPGWARRVVVEPVIGEDGATKMSYHLVDPELGDELQVLLEGEPAVAGISPWGLLLRAEGRSWWFPVRDGPESAPGDYAGSRVRRGPGRGFALRQHDDRIELLLPRSDPGRWTPLVGHVSELIGSWWLREEDLPLWERALLDQHLHEVATVPLVQGEAKIDGDLSDWRELRALAVDSEAQVMSGSANWSGPRDGAFGVVGRIQQGVLMLAARIRDDHLIADADMLQIQLGSRRVDLPMRVEAGEVSGPGWRAVFAAPRDFGIALEIEIEGIDVKGPGPVVSYVDLDPGEGSTRLGTAPASSLAAARGAAGD